MVLCLRCQLGLVNKPNISIGLKILVWNFTNIEYWNVGISISTLISVLSGTVLLFWRFYYSDHRCSNWPNKKRNSVERIIMLKISVSDSKYHIGSEIRTPASPNTNCDSSLIKAHYYKTWRDKSCFERSCFRVLHDLLTKKAELRANTRSSVFSVKWEFAEKKPRPGNLNIQWNPNIIPKDPCPQNTDIDLSPSRKSTLLDSFMT